MTMPTPHDEIHLTSETKDLIHHTNSNGFCDVDFGPIMMSTNAAIFCELLTVKPHELLKADQIWVVESDWSVEIQLKVTCARPFSHRTFAPPTSGIWRKWSGLMD